MSWIMVGGLKIRGGLLSIEVLIMYRRVYVGPYMYMWWGTKCIVVAISVMCCLGI